MIRKPFVIAAASALVLAVSLASGSVAQATPIAVRSSRLPPVQQIDGVGVAADGLHLQIEVGCPKGKPVVKVAESRKAVTIRARYIPTQFDCLRLANVTLKAPLGHRRILDAMTHEPIPRKQFVPLPPTT